MRSGRRRKRTSPPPKDRDCTRTRREPMMAQVVARVPRCGMELIRCPQCAKEIPDVSRFCRRCGSVVAWGASTLTATSTATPWAGLPRSAWDAHRPPQNPANPPSSRNRYRSPSRPPLPQAKRGGGSAWAASAMIGAATFMFVSHIHRATIGPMISPPPVPAERIRTSPVRSAPPPQFYYPRPAGSSSWSSSSSDRRFTVDPPILVPTPAPGKGWDDRYPSRAGRDGRERGTTGWRQD